MKSSLRQRINPVALRKPHLGERYFGTFIARPFDLVNGISTLFFLSIRQLGHEILSDGEGMETVLYFLFLECGSSLDLPWIPWTKQDLELVLPIFPSNKSLPHEITVDTLRALKLMHLEYRYPSVDEPDPAAPNNMIYASCHIISNSSTTKMACVQLSKRRKPPSESLIYHQTNQYKPQSRY